MLYYTVFEINPKKVLLQYTSALQYILISLYASESIPYGNLFGAIILHELSVTLYKILS